MGWGFGHADTYGQFGDLLIPALCGALVANGAAAGVA
jgi:hypothetical protein